MAANTFSHTPVSPPFRQSADSNSQGATQKRQRHPSRKVLQSAIQEKTTELSRLAKTLQKSADSVYAALREKASVIDKSILDGPTQKYEEILSELQGLYAQDKWGDALSEAERVREFGQSNLEYARTALSKAKSVQFHYQLEEDFTSRKSRRSSRTSSSRSSASSARTKALAEAAAAKKQAEYDRIVAEKELERRQREAEEERPREERRAKYDRDIAVLAAEKLAAIADAKLTTIERSMEEEEERSRLPLVDTALRTRH